MNVRTLVPVNKDAVRLGADGPEYNFNSNHALLIGIDKYPSRPLECAVRDVDAMETLLLERLGFREVHVMRDEEATRNAIFERIEDLSKKLTAEDNLLIYYAGHGRNIQGGAGALQPVDAGESLGTQIVYSTFTDLLNQFNVRHLLVLVDCCYGGNMVRQRGGGAPLMPNSYADRSRYILTSGRDHPVPDREEHGDHSPFAARLIEYMGGDIGETVFSALHLEAYLEQQNIRGSSGMFGGQEDQRGLYWMVRHDSFQRRWEQERLVREERSQLVDLFNQAMHECKIHPVVQKPYVDAIDLREWDGALLCHLKKTLEAWREKRLGEEYLEMVLRSFISPTSVKTESTKPIGASPSAVPSGIKPSSSRRLDWVDVASGEFNGVSLPAFKLLQRPVSYNLFMEFLDSEWYAPPADRADRDRFELWQNIWTDYGEEWHTTRDPQKTTHSQVRGYVCGVCWYEAIAFCNWMTWSETGCAEFAVLPDGRVNPTAGYRLPFGIELQWFLVHAGEGSLLPQGCTWEWTLDKYLDSFEWILRRDGRAGLAGDPTIPRVVFNTGRQVALFRTSQPPAQGRPDLLFRILREDIEDAD